MSGLQKNGPWKENESEWTENQKQQHNYGLGRRRDQHVATTERLRRAEKCPMDMSTLKAAKSFFTGAEGMDAR